MKTDFSPFKIGTVFNPLPRKLKNNFPILTSVEIIFPTRLNAMAIDPSKISENKNLIYSSGEILFTISIFNNIKVKIASSNECIISENSKRKSLIKHAFLIMQKAIGFENGLFIDVNNLSEIKHQGMGSSSNLLASVCVAINEMYGCPLNKEELLKYVAQNHGEEIKGNKSELNPVQCIGGSAASGFYEGGVLLLLGENLVAKMADIPEEYSVVLGFPKDFKEIDSKEALKKELENIEGFIECGRKYGKSNAYNVLHKFIPAMIEKDVKAMGDVIYDYRFNMGSIKNCSFLYPKLVKICNKLSELKIKEYAQVLSISSVGPLIFAITKNPKKCIESFEKENLRTEHVQIYNGKYQVLKKVRCEENFWSNNTTIFADKPPCEHIKKTLKNFNKSFGNKILDLGCGGGRNLISAIAENFDIFGIDSSDSMLKETKNKLKDYFSCEELNKRIIKGKLLELPYKNGEFDLVIASGIFHQVKSIKELKYALSITSKIIKKGGVLVGNLFTSSYIDPRMNYIDECTYITKEGLYMTLVSKEKFLEICQNQGFEIKNIFDEEIKEIGTGKRSIFRFELKKIK